MATFKSFNNIILDILDYLRLTQPSLDIKPNSVARDLFVDGQALQIASIYDKLREVAALQSIMNVSGQNLTNYGSNYGVSRKTGTKAIGTIVVTFRSLDSDITIPAGSVVRTRSGIPFLTVSNTLILTTQANALRATATRLRQDLDTAGITEEYAIEVSVEAQSPGSSGDISKYSIISHNIPGANSVTNLSAFTGGTDLETDSSYRARILATFAGTNIGTAFGYRSTILNLSNAIDALVIEPGDPLMTRDGTVVGTDSDGNAIVVEPGTGGRVDIYVMGENLQSGTDSFVYADYSGKDDPTDPINDYVLGQSSSTPDTSLTINSRRVAAMSGTAEVPDQPISKIVSVSGSFSGPNFVEQYTDSNGELKGNYKLVKDTGVAAGSAFGLDKFAWTSNIIELSEESVTKGNLNDIDGLAFTDVETIPIIKQEILVTNENSSLYGSARNYIIIKHTPVKTISRMYNVTTGERYIVEDQAPDDTGTINTTGRVKISGRTLPTASDVLQVDYTWIREFDSFIDFDNFNPKDELDQAQDSVEWGFSNYIRDEQDKAILDSYGNLTITTQFNISRILSIDSYESESAIVTGSSLGKIVQVSNAVVNVHKMTDAIITGNPEVFKTKLNNGNFSNVVIILPTDTLANVGDTVNVVYNLVDVGTSATCINNQITLNPSDIVPNSTNLLVSYVANFLNILPQTNIALLPVSGDGFNSFSIGGYQPVQNLYSGNNIVSNKRRSPSKLKTTVSGIPDVGIIRFVGTTINKLESVFVSTAEDIIDLSTAIRKVESLSNSIYVARVVSLEAGSLTASGEFTSTTTTYDLTNYGIKYSKWDRANAMELSTLTNTQFKLADVYTNTSNPIITGTVLRVVFYYAKENDYEDIFFSRNGYAITNKTFGYVSSINRFYGMQDSGGTISGKIMVDSSNQPENNTTYLVDYDYLAPKSNERITINFEYNKLITDAAEAIESKRPITADVLVKAATKVEIDVEAYIVVTAAYVNSKESVKQDVSDNISAALTASALGTTIDSSDIVNSIYNVAGVDRVRIVRFNKHDVTGTKVSLVAGKNEYFAPGDITVVVEDR